MTDLQLTPAIRQILAHPARYKVLTTGRRWGKDRAGTIWLHGDQMLPDMLYWYVAPYRVQAKAIAWPLLKRVARAFGVGGRAISESELRITWPNGAATELKGADNPDSLLGVGVARCLCSEFARFKPDVWPQIIRPMLTQSKGSVLFESSPNGFDHHYELHLRGMDPDQPDWMAWQYKTRESPFVDPAEVDAARADMDPWLYRQEYEASFETAGNRAVYAFDRALHVLDKDTQGWRLAFGMDFNVEPMVAHLIAFSRTDIHYVDEVVIGNNAHTQMMCDILRKRWPAVTIIYPDPTGGARTSTGPRSNHQILREAGLQVRAHSHAPDHVDRLNAINRMLLNGMGEVHMTMSPRCKRLIEDCERTQRLADGRIDKQFRDPHALDSASYLCEYEFPVQRREVQTAPRWQ